MNLALVPFAQCKNAKLQILCIERERELENKHYTQCAHVNSNDMVHASIQ